MQHVSLPSTLHSMPLLTLTLSPANTQKLHEALLCLSKFSEHVSLEARRHTLCFSALNSTRSAAAAIHLAANRFFDSYHFVQGLELSQEGNEAKFTCRLQTKVPSRHFPLKSSPMITRGFPGPPRSLPPTLPRHKKTNPQPLTAASSASIHSPQAPRPAPNAAS